MSKSRVFCCVHGCNSKAGRDPVSFHYFPKYNICKVEITGESGIVEKVDVRKVWEKNLRCGKEITDTMRVCSKHFEESAFHIQRDLCSAPRKTNFRRRKLKRNAIPTKNLPTDTLESTKRKERRNINTLNKTAPSENDTESWSDKMEEIKCSHCCKRVVETVECIKCNEKFHPSCILQAAAQKNSLCQHTTEQPKQSDEDLKVQNKILNMENTFLRQLLKEAQEKNTILKENNILLSEKIKNLESSGKKVIIKNRNQSLSYVKIIDSPTGNIPS